MVDQESVRAIRRYIERTSDRINQRYGGIIDRIRENFVVELSIRTVRELSEDDIPHMAAGVAYYALFSIFPLILGLISIMSFLLEPEDIQACFLFAYRSLAGEQIHERVRVRERS